MRPNSRRRAKVMKITKLLLCWPCALLVLCFGTSTANADLVTFVGVPGAPPLDAYGTVAHWEDNVGGALGRVADINDDATATGRFTINDGVDYFLNSFTGNDASGSFIQNGSLTVTDSVALNTGFSIQANGNLAWGGAGTLGDGVGGTDRLSLTFGAHTNPSKVVGNSLDVASNGQIQYRWFTSATEGSTVPDLDLSGALSFAAGSQIEITREGGTGPRFIGDGSYFLASASSISGPLPTLTLTGHTYEAGQDAFFLQQRVDGLYLTNFTTVPEPSSIVMFGLGCAMLARRRR